MNPEVIRQALIDALILRQETRNHDISPKLADELVAASIPAFIAWEASQAESGTLGSDEAFALKLMDVIGKLEVHADSAGYVYAHPKYVKTPAGVMSWWPPRRSSSEQPVR